MNAFLKANIKYPKAAKAAKIEGTVRVNYSLDQSGRVVKVQAVEGPKEGGLREEAERVVKLLKFEIPKERKMRIPVPDHYTVPGLTGRDARFEMARAKRKIASARTRQHKQFLVAPIAREPRHGIGISPGPGTRLGIAHRTAHRTALAALPGALNHPLREFRLGGHIDAFGESKCSNSKQDGHNPTPFHVP